MSPLQEVPPRRRKSPRTAPPPTFSYSLTLRPAAAPTCSDPHPHSMSPDCSISHPSSPDVPRPQHLPPYSLTLRTAATPTRSDSHPAAAPNFFLMNLLNKRHKSLHATPLATSSFKPVRIFRKHTNHSARF